MSEHFKPISLYTDAIIKRVEDRFYSNVVMFPKGQRAVNQVKHGRFAFLQDIRISHLFLLCLRRRGGYPLRHLTIDCYTPK